MNHLFVRSFLCLTPLLFAGGLNAADAVADAASPASVARPPDLLELLVDSLLQRFGVPTGGNTLTHWIIFGALFVLAWVLRKFVTTALFSVLKHFASKTETTLDDKLFPALEEPVKTMVFALGSFAAFKVLKLSETVDITVLYVFKIFIPAILFWGIIRALEAVIDHFGEVARSKDMGFAAFVPLMKKTIIILFVILAGLTIIKNFGYDVQAILTGLGIGGLAFALAAQDTIANFFGSMVVALDRPFKVGEVVRIGANEGTVEDIGLRSTKLRTPHRTLISIPNKAVAGEAIVNLTRMPQRRVEQTLGLTYDTTPEKMEAILADIRQILKSEPGIHQDVVVVNFTNYGPSSLDIYMLFFTSDPNWAKHLELRERINLKIMRAVAARGLSFAFPTQTVQLDGPLARRLVETKA